MINLNNVTVVIVDCANQGKAVLAINKTLKILTPARTIFFTDVDINIDEAKTIVIPKIKSKDEYSYFMIKELWKYITTDYCLVIQHDGYPICEEMWDKEFLEFDYIGAVWNYPDNERAVGNGGCSIRSRKLLEALGTDDFIEVTEQEDDAICRLYGAYLEKTHDIVFAPISVAERFSFELREPCYYTFAFHSYFWQPFKKHIVIKRSGATGDIVMAEAIIEYFAKYNYQVVLDIPLDDMKLFLQYPYFLKHISQMNKKIKPIKVINLDMAYEIKPKQLVLKSYYEMAGIKDGELRNSRLYMHQEPHQKIFQKYILIHNDQVNLPHRNSYGVNWELIVAYFQKLGYLVFQIGNNPIEHIAPHYNCPTKDMLMYMCKGADLVIALDSGVAQISVALGTPTIIMAGSVDITLRYSNFEKIGVVQGKCGSEENKHCYHSAVSTTGVECIYDKERPPCCSHSEWNIIEQANKLLNK